jgi:hypothetical protein
MNLTPLKGIGLNITSTLVGGIMTALHYLPVINVIKLNFIIGILWLIQNLGLPINVFVNGLSFVLLKAKMPMQSIQFSMNYNKE